MKGRGDDAIQATARPPKLTKSMRTHASNDDDDENNNDFDEDAATKPAVIFPTCCAKRPSSPNETVGSGGGMGRRVAS